MLQIYVFFGECADKLIDLSGLSTYDNLVFQKAKVQFSSGVHENDLPKKRIQSPWIDSEKKT